MNCEFGLESRRGKTGENTLYDPKTGRLKGYLGHVYENSRVLADLGNPCPPSRPEDTPYTDYPPGLITL